MTITGDVERVPLDGDEYPFKHPADCPWPNNHALHRPWCRDIEGHDCAPWGYHQHRPKVGMGGANPDAKIVAVICPHMSQAVDNHYAIDGGTKYQDGVSNGRYRIWRSDGGKMRPVLDRVIPEPEVSSAESEGLVATAPTGAPSGFAPDVSDVGHSLAGESVGTLADSPLDSFTRDELREAFDAASEQIFNGLLRKCAMVQEDYRRSGSWKETAQFFEISVRTAEGLAGFAAAVAGTSGLTLENASTIAESRSLVQAIGRRAESDRTEALEAAVDYCATYGEPPTPAALAHKLGVERGEKKNVERYTTAQIAELFIEFPEKGRHRNNLNSGFSAFVAWLIGRETA